MKMTIVDSFSLKAFTNCLIQLGRVGIKKKKYCFVKNLDNVLCCVRSTSTIAM